jgi:hypothetical protein
MLSDTASCGNGVEVPWPTWSGEQVFRRSVALCIGVHSSAAIVPTLAVVLVWH